MTGKQGRLFPHWNDDDFASAVLEVAGMREDLSPEIFRDVWDEMKIGVEDEAALRRKWLARNKRLGAAGKDSSFYKDNLEGRTLRRASCWTGEVGEMHYRRWLEERKIKYRYVAAEHDLASFDVGVGGLRVDVKTQICNVGPFPHYDCNLPEDQVKKRVPCDVLVFAFFNEPAKTSYLVGWIELPRFVAVAECVELGAKRTDKFKTRCVTYMVPMRLLKPMEVPFHEG